MAKVENVAKAAKEEIVTGETNIIGQTVSLRANPNVLENIRKGSETTGTLLEAYNRTSQRNRSYVAGKVRFTLRDETGKDETFTLVSILSATEDKSIKLTPNMNVRVKIVENTFQEVTRKQPQFIVG